MTKRQKLTIYGIVLVVVFALLIVLFGWGRAGLGLAGVGAGVGVWLGVRAGNENARETDKYRAEWIARRRGTGTAPPPSTSEPNQVGGQPPTNEEP